MEASAIKQHRRVGGGVRNRTPLLRMQSDERLVTLVRRGNQAAFGALVSRYEARLLAFCRHLLRSREDAEDVLQEVFASAFKAMMADERPIRVRPWLYRIARNRCLNHLRRISAIGVDSIEDHFSEHGPSTSEMAQRREDLWQLVGDIQELPESQRSALLLREMEALSYEQIADVLDKTVPSVKSLLIRARRALAECAEARSLSCEEARVEIDEVHAGVRERPSRVVRRHIASCQRCAEAHRSEPLAEAKPSLPGLRAWLPVGPALLVKKLSFSSLTHPGRAGSTATAAGASAAAGPSLLAGSTAAGFISAGIGGLAGKAAVGLTAAVLGVAGAVVVDTSTKPASPNPPAANSTGAGAAVPGPSGYMAAITPSRHAGRAHARAHPAAHRPPATASRPASTTAPAKATPTAPARSKVTPPRKQVTTAAGSATPATDATDATADPAVSSSPTSPGGSVDPGVTGITPPSATTPTGSTPVTPPAPTGTTPTTPTTPTQTTPTGTTPTTPTTPATPAPATPTTPTTTTTTPAPTSTTPPATAPERRSARHRRRRHS